jgi:hypothetical protein
MPLYLDHHKNLEGLSAEAAVAEDHNKDLEVQHKHGAKALRGRGPRRPGSLGVCRARPDRGAKGGRI